MATSVVPRILPVLAAVSLVSGIWHVPAAVAADVHTVQYSELARTVPVGGTVVTRKEVTLTAQVPGRIRVIAGEEGDVFRKGDILTAMDAESLLAKRKAAVAQLQSAKSSLQNAQAQLQREILSPKQKQSMGGMGLPNMFDQMFSNPMQNMFGGRDTGAERHAQVVQAGTQRDTAFQNIARAEAQVKEIDAKLRDARSVAPFNGVISKKFVEVGDPVQPGQPLLNFVDTSRLQIQADIPTRLLGRLEVGSVLNARLDTGGAPINVTVSRIFPTADIERHTVRVKFDVPFHVEAHSGMYAEVMVPNPGTGNERVMLVPKSAVISKGGLSRVFVVDNENRATLRLVRTGTAATEGEICILSGLRENQRILVDPTPGMRSGTIIAN